MLNLLKSTLVMLTLISSFSAFGGDTFDTAKAKCKRKTENQCRAAEKTTFTVNGKKFSCKWFENSEIDGYCSTIRK